MMQHQVKRGITAKRLAGYTLVFLALIGFTFAALLTINDQTTVLHQGETVDNELASQGCVLSDWSTADNGKRFAFEFIVEDGTSPLSIAVANVSNFDLYCNGECVFKRGSDPSARLAVAQLPEQAGTFSLELVFNQPENLVRAQLSITSFMNGANEAGRMLFAFCLGILFILFAYCLTLWIQKPNEPILVYMTVLIAIVVVRDVTQQFPLTSQLLPTFIKTGLNMALAFGITQLSAEYVFANYYRTHRSTRIIGFAIGVGAILACYLVPDDIQAPTFLVLHGLFHMGCAGIIICGCARKVRCSWAMLAGLAFAICSFTFYTGVDQGYIVAGFLAVQGYIIQFYNVPFLLACMAAINSRFVGYYRELRRINRELDAIVEERVEQLQQQEAQKHQLMTNVFHDLRTPLFIAKNCAERLREDGFDTQALAVLDNRIDFMSSLTQDLFTLAKLETGDLVLTEDIVDFSLLCQRQVDSANLQAALKGVVVWSAIADECRVWGDEHRLEQIIQNLLSNAIAHTESGGSVELDLSRTTDGYALRVTNEGEPIDPDDAAHIFDRYYRVSEGGANDSSGLGLAIVSEIAKAHRGSVRFDGSIPRKPTFVVTLPKLPD